MRLLRGLALIVATTGLGVTTYAHDYIQIGEPTYGGPGCPQGSAQVIATESQIHIGFDQFHVMVGGPEARRIDRKSCGVAVPVRVPAGMQIRLRPLQLQGFARLDSGASATISQDYFLATRQGATQSESLLGPASEEFVAFRYRGASEWSNCGEDTILRLNMRVLLTAEESSDLSFVAISDGTDAAIEYKTCQDSWMQNKRDKRSKRNR